MATETVGRAILEMAADAASLLRGVDAIEGRMKSAAGVISGIGKSLAAAFSVAAIGAAINKYAEFTGQLTDLSAKTGIGVEALQRLKFAAEQNGGSLEQVTGAITKLGANLAGGNKSAVGALEALGLRFDDIRRMEPDKAFTTIADAIAKVPDPMAQAKLAMDLFGKSGAELLPMMKGQLSATAAEAERLGLVMSEEAVAAGDEFGDTMDKLALVGQALIAQVLEPMIPVLTTLAQWLGEKIPGAVRTVVDLFGTGLASSFLMARIKFNEFLLGVAQGINSIPLLGEKIGFSAETIKNLEGNVSEAKNALAIFESQTTTTTATKEKASRTMKTLSLDYGDHEKKVRASKAATEELDPTIKRLTKSLEDQIDRYESLKQKIGAVAATPDWFRLTKTSLVEGQPIMARTLQDTAAIHAAAQRWAETNGAVLAPSIKALGATLTEETTSWSASIKNTFQQLPATILGAIQGGGNVLNAAGAFIGTSMMSEFKKHFGEAIEQALPFGIGKAVTALLPMLGSLFGPVLQKIGGFFRSLFGGPDAEELAGRRIVAAFEQNVQAMLTDQQRLEAGNESWKMTVIAVRDAYIAMGRTEAEALRDVEALWKSSKSGAEAANAAIIPIQQALDFMKAKGTAAGGTLEGELKRDGVAAAGALEGAVNSSSEALANLGASAASAAEQIRAQFNGLRFDIPIGFVAGGLPGLPVVPMAEGGMGRATGPTLFYSAGDEDFAFSGEGRRFGGSSGPDMSGVTSRLESIERTLISVLPTMVESAARHGAQTAGRRK